MTRILLGLLLLSGCAPIYVPGAVHVPLLHKAGDIHAALHGGTHGGQLDAAFAVTDYLAVRASGQAFAGSREDAQGTYLSGGGGISLFYGGPKTTEGAFAHGLRASANLEVHGGRSSGEGELTISNPPNPVVYSARWIRPALQGDVAYEWEYFALGAALRFSSIQIWHDQGTELGGQSASLTSAEPVAFARFGTRAVKFQLQAGLSIPFAGNGNMGLPLPLVIAGGVVLDL